MSCMKWSYGSLNRTQEEDFVFRRLQGLAGGTVPASLHLSITAVISESQEAMRQFAKHDIARSLQQLNKYSKERIEEESRIRAKSVVSLRDIQRVFSVFAFFRAFPIITGSSNSVRRQLRKALLLSVAVVYFMRLDSESRKEYVKLLENLPGERQEVESLVDILEETLDHVIANTSVKKGIARTRGLKENIFMVIVCALSKTPLMIVGPPGCSKVS